MDNSYGLTVELRPSIGEHDSPIGRAFATHAQMEVWAGNRQTELNYGHAMVRVGMCDPSGKHVNWESHAAKWPSDAIAFIAREAARMLGNDDQPVVDIPQNPQHAEVEDMDDDDSMIEEID
ncbi:MAG TPA: hypothetical protein VMX74_07005 [Pirellulales bacterium]|nr:hypothetical protein [Pirellulales bacterium]